MIVSETWTGPRERAAAVGIEQLGDADLVAILLGTGLSGVPAAVLAAQILDEYGGVAGLSRAGVGELSQRAGIGMAKAARLVASVELGRRAVAMASADAPIRLPDRRAVEIWARPRLSTLDHEELWLLGLDGHHGLRAARRVASGGIHGLHVAVRDPLRVALREAASAFILVHNHPSGDPVPSDEDATFTRALATAARAIGTPMLDHVIIARRRSASMLELGLLGP
jgi:DNA repair protein RadC